MPEQITPKRKASLPAISATTTVKHSRVDLAQQEHASSSPSLSHPAGIRPWGNYYFDQGSLQTGSFDPHAIRQCMLGHWHRLTDDLILRILESELIATDLANLQRVSKGFYAFARHEDLWRALTLKDFGGAFTFCSTWRQTYRHCHVHKHLCQCSPQISNGSGHHKAHAVCTQRYLQVNTQIRLDRFYSDTLFKPFMYATASLSPWRQSQRGTPIPRVTKLSLDDFVDRYEKPSLPVIITDVVTQWPAFQKWADPHYLLKQYGDAVFRAEAIDIMFKAYWQYAQTQTLDEAPIYLFDKHFGENCPDLLADFTVPEYFREDLFSLLGANTYSQHVLTATQAKESAPKNVRPDYRWLIVGPQRSGSTFHKDPNATSAWNAVITGSKKWILYPPKCLPPGVYANADESQVTSPVSLMEWFHDYYADVEPYRALGTQDSHGQPTGAFEGTCYAGDLMFVPRGWWHCVLNLDDSIALTQNYVSRRNLPQVLHFLQFKRDQISGIPKQLASSLYEQFTAAFEHQFPGELAQLRQQQQRNFQQHSKVHIQWPFASLPTVGEAAVTAGDQANGTATAPAPTGAINLWETLKAGGPTDFKFGFAEDD
ncbi:hypothetical protein H4R34_002100 [Dimargaris verticillata]|uniref:JmjC domain-containing protein n=1 Tax=Dimargaris verticillata TaxID=2761393 RepID=A0A9W8B4D4_9FUNG|nr:hypothetical protein H4R34_002100 [Dimargaris verticillata]